MATLKHHNLNDCKAKAGAMLDEIDSAIGNTTTGATGATEAPQEAALPEFEFFDAIIDKMPPEPKLLVGGNDPADKYRNALIHQGDKVMLGAESKAGKTWFMLQLGLCIASGTPFLGHQTERGFVLYCNFELRPWAFARRVKRVAEKLGLVDGTGRMVNVPDFFAWNLRGKCYDIERICEVAAERLKRIPGLRIAAIVVDPIYKSYGGKDENSASDMAAVLEAMEKFAERFGAAIFIASHFAKGNSAGKAQIDRISGSGVIARDPDGILTLSKFEEEQNCYALEATLRNMASPEPKVVEFAFPLWEVRSDLKAGGKAYDLSALVALLPNEGMSSTKWFEAAAEHGICARKDNWKGLTETCVKRGLVSVTFGPRNSLIFTPKTEE